MRVQSVMGAAALEAVAEMAVARGGGGGRGRGRGLNEVAEEERPGRSEMAYMQHEYTPLDMRIIIITAAILLLLLSILFLNFFISWALRRFFLLRSQKPMNPNKGLSKRQIQALPSFVYSSSKPVFYFCHPTTLCDHPTFYHALLPISHTSTHNLKPISPLSFSHLHPTQIDSIEGEKLYQYPPYGPNVDEANRTSASPLGSSEASEVDNEPLSECCSPGVDKVLEGIHLTSNQDEVLKGNNLSTIGDVVANDDNSIIDSTKAHVLNNIHSEVKANLPTFKDNHPMTTCAKIDEMPNHGGDSCASSPSPCPICLVDYIDGDSIRVLPSCRHYFHTKCIDTWLAKSSSCPACRANIMDTPKVSTKQPKNQVQVIITTSH